MIREFEGRRPPSLDIFWNIPVLLKSSFILLRWIIRFLHGPMMFLIYGKVKLHPILINGFVEMV